MTLTIGRSVATCRPWTKLRNFFADPSVVQIHSELYLLASLITFVGIGVVPPKDFGETWYGLMCVVAPLSLVIGLYRLRHSIARIFHR